MEVTKIDSVLSAGKFRNPLIFSGFLVFYPLRFRQRSRLTFMNLLSVRPNMEIRELHNYPQKEYEYLRQLMNELSERLDLTQLDLMRVLKAPDSHLYIFIPLHYVEAEDVVGFCKYYADDIRKKGKFMRDYEFIEAAFHKRN